MPRLFPLIAAALLLLAAAASAELGLATCSSDRQLKAPAEGFVVLDPPPYQGFVGAWRVRVPWADLNPSKGIFAGVHGNGIPNAIDQVLQQLSSSRRRNDPQGAFASIQIEILAGPSVPGWVLDMGSFTVNGERLPLWWTPAYQDAYDRLMGWLAGAYDTNMHITGIFITSCSGQAAAPMLRNINKFGNEYKQAGWTELDDLNCQYAAMRSHLVSWRRTPSIFPFSLVEAADGSADVHSTQILIKDFNAIFGSRMGIVSVDERIVAVDALRVYVSALGGGLQFDLSHPGNSQISAALLLKIAVDNSFTSVALPPKWQQSFSSSELNDAARQLAKPEFNCADTPGLSIATPAAIQVNFLPPTSGISAPPGWFADVGAPYALQSGPALMYGWNGTNMNGGEQPDISSDDTYKTYIDMNGPSGHFSWSMAVAPGFYEISMGLGSFAPTTCAMTISGHPVFARPQRLTSIIGWVGTLRVDSNRLTLQTAAGSENAENRLCWISVTRVYGTRLALLVNAGEMGGLVPDADGLRTILSSVTGISADRFSVSLALALRASIYEFEVLVKDQPLQLNSLFIANAIAGVSAAEWRKYGYIVGRVIVEDPTASTDSGSGLDGLIIFLMVVMALIYAAAFILAGVLIYFAVRWFIQRRKASMAQPHMAPSLRRPDWVHLEDGHVPTRPSFSPDQVPTLNAKTAAEVDAGVTTPGGGF